MIKKVISKCHRLKYIDLSFINTKGRADFMTESVHIETDIPGKSQTNLKVSIGIYKMQYFLRFCHLGISNT